MSIKLVVLGLLMEDPRHPYEMQQIFKQRKMERYINFQKKDLYIMQSISLKKKI
ncbi:hypothetical protein [endosymbiont 'TC1' of Trimyema compressum]|uniref:hypothetical protein n=1 Tax=endosymbiont 'TC1' of Trimyema compressum TaxID=243899 RepID=UPI0013924569|nr:hypothetical protein [endosymbiont 'TC1' of Trimyema compressum]